MHLLPLKKIFLKIKSNRVSGFDLLRKKMHDITFFLSRIQLTVPIANSKKKRNDRSFGDLLNIELRLARMEIIQFQKIFHTE